MSVLVTLNCDARAVVAGQDVGTCGTVRHCLVLTAEEAREQSKAQGWSRRGGKDLCPLHTREVQEYMRGHRGRPKR